MANADRYQLMHHIGWNQLQRDCRALAWRLMDVRSEWKGILAVTRGGLIPAAIIARELNIRVVDTICVVSYNGQEQSDTVEVLKGVDHDGDGYILMDDLVDTGKTAQIVRKMVPKAHFATVYAKPKGRPLVDTFITEVSQDTWILFPWDCQPQFVAPIASSDQGKD